MWDDIKKTVKAGFSVAADKTEEIAKIGRVKVEVLNLKKNINQAYEDLGREVHQSHGKEKSSPLAKDNRVKELFNKIEGYQKTLEEKETEIEMIKKDAAKKQAQKKSQNSTES
jgi:hypothetical protein